MTTSPKTIKTMKKITTVIIAITLITFSSCSKDDGPAPQPQNPVNVYVAGYITAEVNVKAMAVWKNGELTQLTSGAFDAKATGVYAQGNDVYVIGREANATTQFAKTVVYKNGNLHQELTDGSAYSVPLDIKIANNKIYIAGYERDANGTDIAKVWVDGNATNLTDGTNKAYASGLAVASNGRIYVSGAEFNTGGQYDAMLWSLSNGNATNLTENSTYGASANALFVDGTDIYVVGSENNGTHNEAVLWKNSEKTVLLNGGNTSNAQDVFVANNKAYIVGVEFVNVEGTYGKLIIGNEVTNLNTSGELFLRNIWVQGNDVYAVGEFRSNGERQAVVFKNGEMTTLSEANVTATASGLFVQEITE